jgi:hypothetical protein
MNQENNQKNELTIETSTPQNDKFFAVRGVIFQWTFLFLAAAYTCLPIYNTSFFADLTFGRWILNHITLHDLGVDEVPYWSYAPNWVFDSIIAFIDSLGSLKLLITFKVCLLFLIFLCVSHINHKLSSHRFFGVFLTLLACMGGFYANEFSATLLGQLFFVLYLGIIFSLSKNWNRKNLLYLFIISILYINAHYSFLLAIPLGVLLFNSLNKQSIAKNGIVIALPVLVFLSLVFSIPNPFVELNYYIAELLTFNNMLTIYNYQLAVLVIVSAICLVFCYFAQTGLAKISAAGVILLGVLATLHSALAPWALIIISFFCAMLWGQAKPENLGNLAKGLDILKNKFDWLPTSGFAFLLSCISIVLLFQLIITPSLEWSMPKEESRFLLKNKELIFEGIAYEPSVGSYLLYKFSNKKGELRADVLINEYYKFSDPAFFKKMRNFCSINSVENFNKAGIDSKTILCPTNSKLVQALKNDENFKMISTTKSSSGNLNTLSSWTLMQRL